MATPTIFPLGQQYNRAATDAALAGKQPLDADLTALAANSTNGILARTGAGTVASRTITGAAGLTVTNGDGVSGNPTLTPNLASQAEAEAGTSNAKLMTPLRVANLTDLGTRADYVARSLPTSWDAVRTSGYASAGDGGEATYVRVGPEPAHLGKFQSADGAWWEYVSDTGYVNANAFGAVRYDVEKTDTFTGTGAQTAFTLSSTPQSGFKVGVMVDGVRKIRTTDFSTSGTTLTFVSAPADAAVIIVDYAISLPGGATDSRAAIQSAMDFAWDNCVFETAVEAGGYLIGSTASPDSAIVAGASGAAPTGGKTNGVVFSSKNTSEMKAQRTLRAKNGQALFVGGAANMVMVRVADAFCSVRNIRFQPGLYAGVIFIGVWPEDRTNSAVTTNNSYFYCDAFWDYTSVSYPAECCIDFQPGPNDASGRTSGCYHHEITAHGNLVSVGYRFRPPTNQGTGGYYNYVTRTSFYGSLTNVNCGFWFDAVGDINLIGHNVEFAINTISGPLGTGAAYYYPNVSGTYAKYVNLIGGYTEACDQTANIANAYARHNRFGHISAAASGTYAIADTSRAFDSINFYGGAAGTDLSKSVDPAGIALESLDVGGTIASAAFKWRWHNMDVLAVTPWLRADNAGSVNVSGDFHGLYSDNGSNPVFRFYNSHATTPRGQRTTFSGGSPNNTSQYFNYMEDATNAKAAIWSDGSFGSLPNVYGAISDKRLKTNVTPARSYLADVMKLNVVRFNWKDDPTGPRQIGLIAQEVAEVFPGLVYTSPVFASRTEDDIEAGTEDVVIGEQLGVKYNLINLMLLKAVQELAERVTHLEGLKQHV